MRRLIPLLTAAFILSCGSGSTVTQTLLFVDTDLEIPNEVNSLEVVVINPELSRRTASAPLGFAQPDPPRTLGVVHGNGALGEYVAVVRGELSGNVVVSREVRFTMQEGRSQRIVVNIQRACRDVSCPLDQTCDAGSCVSPVVTGTIAGGSEALEIDAAANFAFDADSDSASAADAGM